MKKKIICSLICFFLILIIFIPIEAEANDLEYWTDRATNIGYLTRTYTVKAGEVENVRYHTMGWKVEFRIGGVTYTTLLNRGAETILSEPLPGQLTRETIRLPFLHPNTGANNIVWNRSILDNFLLEYTNAEQRNAILITWKRWDNIRQLNYDHYPGRLYNAHVVDNTECFAQLFSKSKIYQPRLYI